MHLSALPGAIGGEPLHHRDLRSSGSGHFIGKLVAPVERDESDSATSDRPIRAEIRQHHLTILLRPLQNFDSDYRIRRSSQILDAEDDITIAMNPKLDLHRITR